MHILRCALRLPVLGLLTIAWAGSLSAADVAPSDPAALAFFDQDVQPILKANCLKCHGGEAKIKGGLRMTTREFIMEGGDTGPAVDLTKHDASLLLKMVNCPTMITRCRRKRNCPRQRSTC